MQTKAMLAAKNFGTSDPNSELRHADEAIRPAPEGSFHPSSLASSLIVAIFIVAAMFVMTESQKSQLPWAPDFSTPSDLLYPHK
jgi:hypothetical protein